MNDIFEFLPVRLTGELYCYQTRKEMMEVYDRLVAMKLNEQEISCDIKKAYNQLGVPYPWTVAIICKDKENLEEVDNYLVRQNIDLGNVDSYFGEQRIAEFFRMMHLGEYEPGYVKVKEGYCPLNAVAVIACQFCPFGHMLECHHPMTCEQTRTAKVKCSHLEKYDNVW